MLGRLRMAVGAAIDEHLKLSRLVLAPKHSLNFIATFANVARARGRCDTKALEKETKNTIKSRLGNDQERAGLMEDNPPLQDVSLPFGS